LQLNNLSPGTQYEFQVAVLCGNGVPSPWSLSEGFSTLAGGNGCANPVVIQCGTPYNGNNSTCIDQFEGYWGNGIDAPDYNSTEVLHKFTLTSTSNVTVTSSGLSANLDLVVLSDCNNYNAIAISANAGTNNEQVVLNNLAPGTYWIAVDAKNNATGNYTLNVTCNTVCAQPTPSEIEAINIGCTTARLNTTITGVYQYLWRYRAVGAANWIALNPSGNAFADLVGLLPNTQYEYQLAVQCSNGGPTGSWSQMEVFTTLSSSNGKQ
jgi:Bacterial pre-peptidase C-terminal domain